jgi:hypothetical protein
MNIKATRSSGNIWKNLGFLAEEAERIFEKNDRAARSHAQPL